DGRVPHALGLLDGVKPTYYVRCTHGDLARNPAVLGAIDELVEEGKTNDLPDELPGERALRAETKEKGDELRRQWAARFAPEGQAEEDAEVPQLLRRLDREVIAPGADAVTRPLVRSDERDLAARMLQPLLGSETDVTRAAEARPAPPPVVVRLAHDD